MNNGEGHDQILRGVHANNRRGGKKEVIAGIAPLQKESVTETLIKENMMKKKIGPLLLVLSLLAVILSFVTCTKSPKPEETQTQSAQTESLVDTVLKRGVLKVGCGIFVPWSFKDKDGNMVGFEVDVATKLAKDMGVELELIPTEWSGIIPALLTGKFDIIIGGMGINPDRALKVNFTIPYNHTGQNLAASKNLSAGLRSIEDFNRPEIVLSVRMGATPVAAAKKLFPNAELRQFDSDEAVIQEVLNGNANAALSASPTPELWAARYPDKLFLPLDHPIPTGAVAIAVRKGDFDSICFLNSWIEDNLSDGWIRSRYEYWFESLDWQSLTQ
jgi:polar amino acid transport system substrate-binding protein